MFYMCPKREWFMNGVERHTKWPNIECHNATNNKIYDYELTKQTNKQMKTTTKPNTIL